ncbi:MAG: histidinol-phosphate aminotransferase family protein [Gemmatimonadaceae bacterium]|nr:histidinol-phosphate aminotransferase family protein [Gemmatimonadaceae bacterium]
MLRTYSPGAEVECRIDLSDNTNRWGIPPAAAAALRNLDPAALTRYPSSYGDALKGAIATHLGIDVSNIVTGAGSDGVLEPAIRAFAQADGQMVLADPTFVMAAPFGRMNGLAPAGVPLLPSYDIDARAMVEAAGCVTYLCAPNNPTGTSITRDALDEVIAGAPGLVIIDEAYADFSASDAIELACTSDRVLVLRTLSKAFGLAGLRVGYGVGAPALVQAVEKARGPYTVNAVAERAAVAALRDDAAWVAARIGDAVAAREWLATELGALGLDPAPSEANFVFVPVADAAQVAARMADAGVRVRAFDRLPAFTPALERSRGSALRITVAPAAELEPAVAALRRALGGGDA